MTRLSLSKGNTKNSLSLKQNNFFSKERHSSLEKLDAVIQEDETLSSEVDELLMRFKKSLNRPSSIFNNNNKLCIIPFKKTLVIRISIVQEINLYYIYY